MKILFFNFLSGSVELERLPNMFSLLDI